MQEIDPINQIRELESFISSYYVYVKKYLSENGDEQPIQFDLFTSPIKEVTLKKKSVLGFMEDVIKKLEDIRKDFENAGIHYTDNEKASSEFAEYLRNTYEERHKKTVVFLDYQNRLYENVKKMVKKELLADFNKIYTKEKDKVFTTIVKNGKGGFTSEDLINYIDGEIQCLPQYCLRDCFDENANVKQYRERHFDATLKIKNSLNTDEKGSSIFVFEWQRNSDGNIIQFRMRIGDKNKWYNIFADENEKGNNKKST